MDNRRDDSTTGSLRRGLQILGLLRRRDGGTLAVAQIAASTGIPRPSVYRLLETLEAEHYVRRDPTGKRFAIDTPDDHLDDTWVRFTRSMLPAMQRIAQRTGNAVFLTRQDGDDLLCLHREIGTYPVQILSLKIGGRQPLGVGAAGIALLSSHGARARAAILDRNRLAYLDFGNLHVSTVKRHVETCQTRGYSVVANYSLKGVLAVGILLQAGPGLPVAAISVTAPLDRMTIARQRQAAEAMREEVGDH